MQSYSNQDPSQIALMQKIQRSQAKKQTSEQQELNQKSSLVFQNTVRNAENQQALQTNTKNQLDYQLQSQLGHKNSDVIPQRDGSPLILTDQISQPNEQLQQAKQLNQQDPYTLALLQGQKQEGNQEKINAILETIQQKQLESDQLKSFANSLCDIGQVAPINTGVNSIGSSAIEAALSKSVFPLHENLSSLTAVAQTSSNKPKQTAQKPQTNPTPLKKRPYRKRQRDPNSIITPEFLARLPNGFVYCPDENDGPEGNTKKNENRGGDIVQCGDFAVDIEVVSKAQLISMRKALPQDEYRLLKNRKSARICRRKRKIERGSMQTQMQQIQMLNTQLQKKLINSNSLLEKQTQKVAELTKDLEQAKLSLAKLASQQSPSLEQGRLSGPLGKIMQTPILRGGPFPITLHLKGKQLMQLKNQISANTHPQLIGQKDNVEHDLNSLNDSNGLPMMQREEQATQKLQTQTTDPMITQEMQKEKDNLMQQEYTQKRNQSKNTPKVSNSINKKSQQSFKISDQCQSIIQISTDDKLKNAKQSSDNIVCYQELSLEDDISQIVDSLNSQTQPKAESGQLSFQTKQLQTAAPVQNSMNSLMKNNQKLLSKQPDQQLQQNVENPFIRTNSNQNTKERFEDNLLQNSNGANRQSCPQTISMTRNDIQKLPYMQQFSKPQVAMPFNQLILAQNQTSSFMHGHERAAPMRPLPRYSAEQISQLTQSFATDQHGQQAIHHQPLLLPLNKALSKSSQNPGGQDSSQQRYSQGNVSQGSSFAPKFMNFSGQTQGINETNMKPNAIEQLSTPSQLFLQPIQAFYTGQNFQSKDGSQLDARVQNQVNKQPNAQGQPEVLAPYHSQQMNLASEAATGQSSNFHLTGSQNDGQRNPYHQN